MTPRTCAAVARWLRSALILCQGVGQRRVKQPGGGLALRTIVIGTGFGRQHLSWLSECPGAEVRFIGFSSDERRARELAAEFGVPGVTGDPLAVIESGEVDAVAVASPPATHELYVNAAVTAGLTVVSDKPLAADVASAARIADRAKAAGVANAVTFQWRANTAFRRLKELVSMGQLGEVVHLDLEFRHDFLAGPTTAWPWRHRWQTAGGGALGDMGVHLFDQVRWLVPGDWSATAATASVVWPRRQAIDGSVAVECETDDVAEVLLSNGTAGARVFVSRVSSGYRTFRVQVSGTQGVAVLTADPDDGSATLTVRSAGSDQLDVRFGPDAMNPYAALLARDPESASFLDGYAAQLLVDEALRLGGATPSVILTGSLNQI
ncbi:Gfo/Idh/MocA family oxidoreductase [Lentzea sp. NPDC004782]|uniref:Gfo/Idh/MocA family protein n=1 Tax=Lentzea sp. NPDC004782 TaxID=3154458 RepID=UPI0033B46B47